MGIINTRISLRYDSYDNWNTPQGKEVVLNKGEVGICSITQENADQPTVMFKVGNGLSAFKDLPWTSGLASDVYDWAKRANLVIANDGEGEIITNIVWDDTIGAIRVSRKTLKTSSKNFALEGMVAIHENGVLLFSPAKTENAITSVDLA